MRVAGLSHELTEITSACAPHGINSSTPSTSTDAAASHGRRHDPLRPTNGAAAGIVANGFVCASVWDVGQMCGLVGGQGGKRRKHAKQKINISALWWRTETDRLQDCSEEVVSHENAVRGRAKQTRTLVHLPIALPSNVLSAITDCPACASGSPPQPVHRCVDRGMPAVRRDSCSKYAGE